MGWFTDNLARFKPPGLNEDGQPFNERWRAHAVQARQVDELIGLVKGVLADGAICQSEVEFLLGWMNANQQTAQEWPARAIYPRIAEALADGHMDAEEEADIMALLLATTGGNHAVAKGEASNSTRLPLCEPAPHVTFGGRNFCFTGKFSSGSRAWCHEQVHNRGGFAIPGVTKKLHYLVIGDIGSRDWLHSTHGTKIKKAMDYREAGTPLRIVSEQHWFDHLTWES
ncbi:BRCT domain-containing protein [Bordetella genomosp. 9]|uniref:BRCT domain-containing protein n=1 Tax=Bordetella genomosp. 9 TaxID=1416803 RepID=A0A1W6YXJ3_9BORD|nr:BRCT domain-containing protein [Bordetella genomosp. 9]ARP85815.1 hypothetical protein CAL13_06040 [Bordetella genomosp. 9]